MNNQESEFTKEQFIDILSILQKEIKSFNDDKSNKSIGKQLGVFQNFNDLVTEINSNRILFPEFYIQLKIFLRNGWNGRGGSKNRDFI
jgi:hypothetical protein